MSSLSKLQKTMKPKKNVQKPDSSDDENSSDFETLSEDEEDEDSEDDEDEDEDDDDEDSEDVGKRSSKHIAPTTLKLKKELIKMEKDLKSREKDLKSRGDKISKKMESIKNSRERKSSKHRSSRRKKKEESSEESSDDSDDDDSDDEDEDSDEDDETEEEKKHKKNKKKQNNLILYIGGGGGGGGGGEDDDYDDEDEYSTDELLEEHEEEEYHPDEEAVFMKEKYEKLDPESVVEKEEKKSKGSKSSKKGTKEEEESAAAEKKKNVEDEYMQLLETKKTLLQELKRRPNKIYKKALEECNQDIQKLVRSGKKNNLKRYHEIIKMERKKLNEYDYFLKKLSNKEQNRIIDDLDQIHSKVTQKKPYRFTILESSISPNLKSIALQKVGQLQTMCSMDAEYHKIKNWIDTFMKIPFGLYKHISVNMEKDGLEACNQFMNRAQTILDECTYGLKEAKLQIMQMLGNWITNPTAIGTSIAIKGPPGTGKTSLVKDGISKIMGREFVFIPLGGTGDGSYLEGHSYTYEGSTWGKIVQSLIECKSMNPVFYFDELDKLSETPRGQEIIGILTHLTDTTQNTQFNDKYFAEISEFDLSKCLFIFSYNDETKINPILLNRMHVISTKGYTIDEKLIIGRKYLLPKIIQQVKMGPEDIVLTDDILRYILSNDQLCKKEDGVRNLKRSLEIIYTKLNLYRVMKSDSEFFKNYTEIPTAITFPHTVTKQDLDLLIKNNETINQSLLSMYL